MAKWFALIFILIFQSLALAVTGGGLNTDIRFDAIRSLGISRSAGTGFCTGTFISKRHLLTAAHCFPTKEISQRDWNDIGVSNFPLNVSKGRFYPYENIKVYIHPHFAKTGYSHESPDVAIIELDFDAGTNIIPVSGASLKPDQSVIISGYGCDLNRKPEKNLDFQTSTKKISAVSGHHYKLSAGTTGLCKGDSGGPILLKTKAGLKIFGVNSYANRISGFFGMSADRVTRIDNASPQGVGKWIQNVLAGKIKAIEYHENVDSRF